MEATAFDLDRQPFVYGSSGPKQERPKRLNDVDRKLVRDRHWAAQWTKLTSLRERVEAGEVYTLTVALKFFFRDLGRVCMSYGQIAGGLGCSVSLVKVVVGELLTAGRLRPRYVRDDDLASFRQRANHGYVRWLEWVDDAPQADQSPDQLSGTGQQPLRANSSLGSGDHSDPVVNADHSGANHQIFTAPGDHCTCAQCSTQAGAVAPAINPVRTPRPRVSNPSPSNQPTRAPTPAHEAATRGGVALPAVEVPAGLLAALKGRHGQAGLNEIRVVLQRDEARLDTWCTLAALKVLARRTPNSVGAEFTDLIRRALAGEDMNDPAGDQADDDAERRAIRENPDLANEGVGVVVPEPLVPRMYRPGPKRGDWARRKIYELCALADKRAAAADELEAERRARWFDVHRDHLERGDPLVPPWVEAERAVRRVHVFSLREVLAAAAARHVGPAVGGLKLRLVSRRPRNLDPPRGPPP